MEAGNSAVAPFTVTLPANASGREVTLIGQLEYAAGGADHVTDCWLTLIPTPQYEVTTIPSRLVVSPGEEPKEVGMSVINHNDVAFKGSIRLSPTPGIDVKPNQLASAIDPQGLDSYTFKVKADERDIPGHYAVYIDVGDKARDWTAVDVAALAKKAPGAIAIAIDGKLDDWSGVPDYPITKVTTKPGTAQPSYATIGTVRFCYDDANFYMAFDVHDANHEACPSIEGAQRGDGILAGFDPLMNGARTNAGGYKEDDFEYSFADVTSGPGSMRTGSAPSEPKAVQFAFARQGSDSIYEIAIPWTQLKPFVPGPGKIFGLGAAVTVGSGPEWTTVEWGGGIARNKDPRLFIPIALR